MSKKVMMSVDAGGTKTKVALIDFEKNILFEKVGESGSPAVLKEKAIENIFRLVRQVVSSTLGEFEIVHIQMGISGLGVIKNKAEYEKSLSEELNIPVSMENDAMMALFSTVTDKYDEGIVILAGTGSAVCGIDKDDNFMLNGGWGHLLTEDGSGYTCARSLIIKMIYEYEHGLEICPIGKKVMAMLDVVNLPDIRNFVYFKTKDEIASLARFISDEAKNGDEDAIEILEKAGDELADRVIVLSNRMGIECKEGKSVLGFRGSFVANNPIIINRILETVNKKGYKFALADSSVDPVYGGFYMAKRRKLV